ncbi:MAG: thiamine pyrophosphate-dependent enzyme [Actinomycetota bacterium]|nr:thiamine pyrophosphate-dependent enzyme [Actinomycetota bacterium]
MTTTLALPYDDLPRLMALMTGAEKHGPSATSTLDVIWVLYDRILRVDPRRPGDANRDRFLLSKGHGPMAFYAVLAAKGFLREDELAGFGGFSSRLGHHPDRLLVPGVEISSGSLGHGLPLAVGICLGLRARGSSQPRVVVLVGDAELDEGSNWEAVVAAARLGLDALTVVVIDNSSSSLRWPGGLAARFALEGFRAQTVDGRDHEALAAALADTRDTRPAAVVATVEPKE